MWKLKTALLFLAFFTLRGFSQDQKRNLLTSKYDMDFLKENIVSIENYHPLPLSGSEEWTALPEKERQEFIVKAEELLGYDYPVLKASLYLDFVRDGNRSRFQSVYSERRKVVETLLMAEILENKGRFMDDIVNGIWAICEETTWVLPAHIQEQKAGPGLPDIQDPTTAIVASETPSLLAAALYYTGDRLDSISPLIRERIEYEVKRQMLDEILSETGYWWMGYSDRVPNNWNPWVVSNYINALLFFEKDTERKALGMHKAIEMLDNFLNHYPDDGGCDEGPAYWNHAGGRVFDCLELLYVASDGKIDIFDEELIQNIGDYIWKSWINDQWYVNFADAPAKMNPDYSLIYRFGKRLGSSQMMGFAKMLSQKTDARGINAHYMLLRGIPGMLVEKEIANYSGEFKIETYLELPDLQVIYARSQPNSDKGLYFAVKGGHNDESHNHNDAGSFILYLNGDPLLVDAGVGEYTRKTFSHRRYEIWTMQSSYHNLPEINGVMQQNGREFEARNFQAANRKQQVKVSMNLEKAYPDKAGIATYRRELSLNRKKRSLELKDEFRFLKTENQLAFHFLTNKIPVVRDNKVFLSDPSSGKNLAFVQIRENAVPVVEKIKLDDNRLESSWGPELYRIVFTVTEDNIQADFSFLVQELEP